MKTLVIALLIAHSPIDTFKSGVAFGAKLHHAIKVSNHTYGTMFKLELGMLVATPILWYDSVVREMKK
jgi:hypothetical protein